MQKYIPVLMKTQLFSGVGENDIEAMLACMQAKLCSYKKSEYVLRQGERVGNIMVLVRGKLHIQRDDYWGNRSIISVVSPGEMFGEAYAAPESGPILNDVLALEDSAVIFFDVKRIISVCPSACKFHSIAVQNLFFAISEKNRNLVRKLGVMSRRTTREKLIAYLSDEAKRQRSSSFSIPFNRQQLADFLSVDRSAMSNELCRMRDEGLLEFEKNRFVLH
ncbi:MAG: Crp/Fnr family transcriptional regulator [Oscillospiraceae bacterium]|nr:Crp/Fnr family transcriptional regulator [Oscillospiraceae bacterium]